MMKRRQLPWLVGLALLPGVSTLGQATACSTNNDPALSEADATPEAADARSDFSLAVTPEPDAPPPDANLPELDGKWRLFPDFLPSCALYLPKTRDDMPTPLRWEPCPNNPATPTRICQKVVTDWGSGMRDRMEGFRRTNGAVVLMSNRKIDGDRVHLISEPDGPVEFALREHSDVCGLSEQYGDSEYYSYYLAGGHGKGHEAALAGRLGEPPRLLNKHPSGEIPTDYSAGGVGLVANDSFAGAKLIRWDDPTETPIPIPVPADAADLQNYLYRFQAGALFWPASIGHRWYRTVVYTPETGSRILVTNGESTTSGASDLSSDGIDMVWLEGNGRRDGGLGFATFTILTAPSTLDPNELRPRRIATDLEGDGFNEPFTVACGRAARYSRRIIGGVDVSNILIVRLSDGAQWRLDNKDMYLQRPLGMTCDEIFVHAVLPNNVRTIARIRFDSLGAPAAVHPPVGP